MLMYIYVYHSPYMYLSCCFCGVRSFLVLSIPAILIIRFSMAQSEGRLTNFSAQELRKLVNGPPIISCAPEPWCNPNLFFSSGPMTMAQSEGRLTNFSAQELRKLVNAPPIISCAPEPWCNPNLFFSSVPKTNFWGRPNGPSPYSLEPENVSYSLAPVTNMWGEPNDPPRYPYSKTQIIGDYDPLPIPPSSAPKDKVYGWDFPSQATQPSDIAAKPDEDISTVLASDEHVGGSSVSIDAEMSKTPGGVESIKAIGDAIPSSGSQDGCRARDSSANACYMCGQAEQFAEKCSLGSGCGRFVV